MIKSMILIEQKRELEIPGRMKTNLPLVLIRIKIYKMTKNSHYIWNIKALWIMGAEISSHNINNIRNDVCFNQWIMSKEC